MPKGSDIKRMFADIAGRYDLANHLLSLGIDYYWRSKLVREVKVSHPKSVVDLATGSGDVAFALKKELDHLKSVERPRIIKQIAEARDKGDLSENAEYDAAKEAQGLLELEISKLEETVANARIIDESQLDTSKVLVLSTVKIKNTSNNAVLSYKLVAASEADLAKGKISVDSPIGKGLLGKKVGDTTTISVPNGTVKFEILEITR